MSARITLRYEVLPAEAESWVLPEDTMPESAPHDRVVELIRNQLQHHVARTGRAALVGRNLAIRWVKERWRIGVDPDVCLVEPPPPEGDEVESVCTWMPGHHAPALAVEVVSGSNAYKDYASAPERYAACGTRELWVFDPKLAGPRARGPFRLQQWLRDEDDGFRRVYAGDGPFFSPTVSAWVFAVSEGRQLRLADDRDGTSWWTTGEEAERAAKEAERAAKEAALARIAELEAQLGRKS